MEVKLGTSAAASAEMANATLGCRGSTSSTLTTTMGFERTNLDQINCSLTLRQQVAAC